MNMDTFLIFFGSFVLLGVGIVGTIIIITYAIHAATIVFIHKLGGWEYFWNLCKIESYYQNLMIKILEEYNGKTADEALLNIRTIVENDMDRK